MILPMTYTAENALLWLVFIVVAILAACCAEIGGELLMRRAGKSLDHVRQD
jgi:hypothetical protein